MKKPVLCRIRLGALLAVACVFGAIAPAVAPPLTIWSAPCTASVTITTTTETVLCTLVVQTVNPGQFVRLVGSAQVTLGTGATALTLRWRRGATTAGTLVGPANAIQGTAGNTVQLAHEVEDTPGEVSAQSYVLTAQQTAATANGTGLFSELLAMVF